MSELKLERLERIEGKLDLCLRVLESTSQALSMLSDAVSQLAASPESEAIVDLDGTSTAIERVESEEL